MGVTPSKAMKVRQCLTRRGKADALVLRFDRSNRVPNTVKRGLLNSPVRSEVR